MTGTKHPVPDLHRLQAALRPFGQDHLLRFWEQLSASEREQLAVQIEALDLELIAQLSTDKATTQDWAAMSRRAAPPPAMRLADRQGGGIYDARQARRLGAEALAAGRIGVILVAGGQGTRLGFEHPKGLFPIGPVSKASLLQIHCEKVLATSRRHGAPVPLYVMTSPATDQEQREFLKRHAHFGLSTDDVMLFCQGTMPAVDAASGKMLLASRHSLFLSPDGHGGMLAALDKSGALAHMQRRGIEHLFYFQVDNPLTPICDPEFIGYHLLADSELTSMAVAKQTPQDRLGNFAMIDGRLHVIEYSDLPDDVAEKRGPDGELIFWAGSIAVHVFRRSFLERALALQDAMPYHIAHKKVPHVDQSGELREPTEPNALKFERFIFDLVPHAGNPLVVEYADKDVFAPLKNAPGESRDTPEYVHRYMIDMHRRWLEAAGTFIAPDAKVEISPLWALDAASAAERPDRPSAIREDTYLSV